MPKIKKISLPKIQKKIKSFLTDESGKITKKDAIGLAAAGTIIAAGDEAIAAHSSHTSGTACGHVSQAALSVYTNAGHLNNSTSAHSSGIVNGHYNRASNSPGHQNSTVTGGHVSQAAINSNPYCTAHSSHGSHGNHENGGWC